MTTASLVTDLVTAFKNEGRIVIVGASLAGLRGAEALRERGFRGPLTIIGDQPHEPDDCASPSRSSRLIDASPGRSSPPSTTSVKSGGSFPKNPGPVRGLKRPSASTLATAAALSAPRRFR
jgi:hypothetical protein